MTIVHCYASTGHYAEHMRPIMEALPESMRGEMFAVSSTQPWGRPLLSVRGREQPDEWWLVAGFSDCQALGGRRLIYVEHGAGQAYIGTTNGSYSGGAGHSARLFIAPSRRVAQRWSKSYPGTPVAVVGSPKLDRWHRCMSDGPRDSRGLVVAVTFHWDCRIVPETRSAYDHYRRSLPGFVRFVRSLGGEVLGHAHPRWWRQMRPMWERLGVEPVPLLADVLDRATHMVADNTSAMYEFASLDRPVLVLNAPWYRRDVHHGMRFWDAVPGFQVDGPADWHAGLQRVITDSPCLAESRREAIAGVYSHTDGRAAERAAAAIVEVTGA